MTMTIQTTEPLKRVRLLRGIPSERPRRVRLTRRARPTPRVSIIDACNDPQLFAGWFKDKRSWRAWFAFLSALFALDMDERQEAIYRECTDRTAAPAETAKEAWLVIGRRGGKSFILALIAVYLSCFRDYRPYLQPGERATFMVIAADRKQARIIMRYIRGLLTGVPMLARMLDGPGTKESIDLTNSVTIEVHTASFRSARGYACCGAAVDEIAFMRSEDSANPDTEILNALRPAMATIPGALLLCASSPYARRGALWQAHKKHFGRNGDPILVWQAPTKRMNPKVPQHILDEAYEDDPASAAAEYGAQFRADIEALVPREVVEACISPRVYERPFVRNQVYSAFVDPSGGSADSFCLAIGHKEGEGAILDLIRERKPPFSPEAVVEEFAAVLKQYRISRVVGDRYAGEWPRERFLKHGIIYEPSAKPKSDLYRDLLPLLNGKRADLLDNERMLNQIVGLERKVTRGTGRDSIDAAPRAHEDVANVVAGVLTNLVVSKYRYDVTLSNVCRKPDDPPPPRGAATAINRYALLNGSGFW